MLAALFFAVPFSHAGELLLFEDNAVLEVELSGPLGSLFEDVDDEQERAFAIRTNGVEQSLKVKVRGNSRRRVCSFPPLRLNFKVHDTAPSVFQGQDKLKLVTHCRVRRASEVNALKEYAAYRIFNIISDYSYRVRLLRISYSDTDGTLKEDESVRYGFVLEPTELVAARLGAELVQAKGVSLRSLNDEQEALVYVFQYLIGNTDWSLVAAEGDDTCCHNAKLFDIEEARYYVPYDFDLSGLVNASYAKPDGSLRIRRVTQRLYRGFCLPPDQLKDAIYTVNSRRTEIMNVIRDLPGLSEKESNNALSYIDKFFDEAADEDKLLRAFERKCL